jgi:hypothetical protein
MDVSQARSLFTLLADLPSKNCWSLEGAASVSSRTGVPALGQAETPQPPRMTAAVPVARLGLSGEGRWGLVLRSATGLRLT